MIFTSDRADADAVGELRSRGVQVEIIGGVTGLLPIRDVLRRLRVIGIRSLLVEGGSGVITTVLGSGEADRLIVSIAPTVIGRGTEAVADLGIGKIGDGIRLTNRDLLAVEQDLILAWDIEGHRSEGSVHEHMDLDATADIAV